MSRIKINLPSNFNFSVALHVRITDLNYGNHVGNDAILSLIHEARMQFLQHHGYTEMQMENCSIIMSDVAIEFKSELFYGDSLIAFVTAAGFTRVGFDLYYRLQKNDAKIVALAKSGMVCYDYKNRKVMTLPQVVKMKLGCEVS